MTCDDILWYLMCHLTKCKLDTVTNLKCWENDGKRNMHIKAVHYRTLSYNVVQSSSEDCNPQQHILIEVVEQHWTTLNNNTPTSHNIIQLKTQLFWNRCNNFHKIHWISRLVWPILLPFCVALATGSQPVPTSNFGAWLLHELSMKYHEMSVLL